MVSSPLSGFWIALNNGCKNYLQNVKDTFEGPMCCIDLQKKYQLH